MAGGSVPRQYAAMLDDDGFEDPVFETIPRKLLKAKAFSVRCHKTVYNADNVPLEILLRCFANGSMCRRYVPTLSK
jgi:phosphoribosylaminoimidazole-succinocarboxamide synthase